MIKVFLLKVPDNVTSFNFEVMLYNLSYIEKNKILSLKTHNLRIRKLYSYLFQRYIIAKECNISKNDVHFKYLKLGKPFIDIENFYFNTSHSENQIAFACSNNKIGIDIEKIKDIDINIAQKFFTNIEYENILTSKNKNDTFFSYWTLKESFVKYLGSGLFKDLNSFSIINNKSHFFTKFNNKIYNFKTFDYLAGYKLSVCYKKEQDIEIEIIDSEKINSFF